MTRRQKIHEALLDAKKALGALTAMEAAAVGYGLLDSQAAGFITAGIGIATAGVVFVLNNEPKPDRS